MMVKNQKMTGRASSMPAGLAYGLAVSMAVTLLGSALLASLVDRETLAWENVGYGVMAMVLAASFLGATAALGKIKRQKLPVGLLSGMIYWLCLLAITALFFGGQYDGAGVTGLLILGGSICAVLLHSGQKRGGKRRK